MSKIFYFGAMQSIIASTRNKLQKYPAAFICTLAGYAGTHVIMFAVDYKNLKKDISEINMISVNLEDNA